MSKISVLFKIYCTFCNRQTSRMQKVARHIGQEAWFRSHVSLSLASCLLANHRPRHETHHIGRQKQFVQFSWWLPSMQSFLIFTSGAFTMHAKHVSELGAIGETYLGLFSASLTKTSMKRSMSEVWNLTELRMVIGRFTRSWRSLKSSELILIEKSLTPSLVGFTWIFTNCTESVESWMEMLCESLLIAISAESDWCAKRTK